MSIKIGHKGKVINFEPVNLWQQPSGTWVMSGINLDHTELGLVDIELTTAMLLKDGDKPKPYLRIQVI